MKRFVLFLLGVVSSLILAIVLVRHPDEDPQEKLKKDKENLD